MGKRAKSIMLRATAGLPLVRAKVSAPSPELYPLHPGQQHVSDTPARFKVVVCGRRWGKSRLSLKTGVMAAFDGNFPYDPASPPVVVFGMPTLKQCKKIFWKPLINLLTGHPGVEQINKSELSIKLKGNRPEILCLGLNDQDGDRARGLRIAMLLGDEWQDVKPSVWDEVLRPAMADTPGSMALLTGTPKGKVNHLYKTDLRSNQFEDWASFHFKTIDNPHIDPAEIERARQTQEPRIFRQEWEASYEDFPGQIFDHLSDHHLATDTPASFKKTILGIDWGDVNPALVVAGLDNGGRWWLLDSWYSSTGVNVLDSELLLVAKGFIKKWNIVRAWAGHDRPASIQKWNDELPCFVDSWQNATTGKPYTVNEGNSAVNSLLYHDKLFVAPYMPGLKDKMGSYHRKIDKNGNVLEEIESGQDDHEIDAIRYCVASEVLEPEYTFSSSKARMR